MGTRIIFLLRRDISQVDDSLTQSPLHVTSVWTYVVCYSIRHGNMDPPWVLWVAKKQSHSLLFSTPTRVVRTMKRWKSPSVAWPWNMFICWAKGIYLLHISMWGFIPAVLSPVWHQLFIYSKDNAYRLGVCTDHCEINLGQESLHRCIGGQATGTNHCKLNIQCMIHWYSQLTSHCRTSKQPFTLMD